MSIEQYIDQLGDYAKDVRINLKNLLTEEGAAGLSKKQIFGTALSCAYSTQNLNLVNAILEESKGTLEDAELNAAKAASTIMAMNNIYYRTMHLAENDELKKLPAKLRMTVIGNPGIPKADFELYCLAISAMAGCGACINSHAHEVGKAGVPLEGIQSAVRIASVVNSASQAQIIA